MTVDFYASEPQFLDHLAPIWRATREAGAFGVLRGMMAHAEKRGVRAQFDLPHDGNPVVVASYGDVKRMRRQPRRIAFIEHGIGQSYAGDPRSALAGSYAGGRDRDGVGLYLVPNETSAQRWREAYPAAIVRVIGCPKNDRKVPAPQNEEPVVAVSFHWECEIAPETRSARREFGNAVVALSKRFRVLGHGHPRAFAMDRLERFYRQHGIEVVTDFEEVLARADLYVFDNTSSGYEFAAQGRPVVVMNPTGYRRNVYHGLRFWDAASVGVNVDRADELIPAVELALFDPPEVREAREAALRIVYAYRDDMAALRAARAIAAWANAPIEVAA